MEPLIVAGGTALALWRMLRPKDQGSGTNHAPETGAHGSFRWANRNDLERIDAFRKAGLPVGWFEGVPFFHTGDIKPHGLVIGNTGSRKTTGVLANIGLSDFASKCSIVNISVSPDWSAICLPYRSKLGPCWRLDPAGMLDGLDLGATKLGHYNPLGEYLRVRDRVQFPLRAAKLAGTFIRTHDSRDRYFWQMAQRAVEVGIRGLALHAPKYCNPHYLAKIFNEGFFGWVKWLSECKDLDEFTLDLAGPFLPAGPGMEMAKSIPEAVNSVYAELRWLNETLAASTKRSDFSFRSFADEVSTCDICAPLNLLHEGWDRWVSLIAECALSELQESAMPKPVIFLFDEVATYASESMAKTISRIYSTGRKYNLRVYCAVTSLSALERAFPDGGHNDVLGQSGVIHFLSVSDPRSSGFVKEMGGEKTAISVSSSHSSGSSGGAGGWSSNNSTSRTPHGVPVIRSEMVRAIPANRQLVMLDQVPYLIYAEKRSFLEVPEHRARAGQNPFWSDDQRPTSASETKRKKKIDEVALVLKDYGHK
jgi:type IV secretory pathway TraG/TraD family ATPase VirD4